jgi:hypothetical protein
MKKNLIAGIVVSLAMTGMFGGVSFAADKAAEVKPAAATEVKADAKAEAPAKKKVAKKKAAKKAVAKKAAAKKEAAKKEVAPAAAPAK